MWWSINISFGLPTFKHCCNWNWDARAGQPMNESTTNSSIDSHTNTHTHAQTLPQKFWRNEITFSLHPDDESIAFQIQFECMHKFSGDLFRLVFRSAKQPIKPTKIETHWTNKQTAMKQEHTITSSVWENRSQVAVKRERPTRNRRV